MNTFLLGLAMGFVIIMVVTSCASLQTMRHNCTQDEWLVRSDCV